MLKTVRFIVAIAVALVVTASTTLALAAPVGWDRITVTLQPGERNMLLVTGDLPDGAKLPYKGELAVPAGLQVQWVGEILGGAASADPAMQYVKRTADGMDIYSFTLTKSRRAQVEGAVQPTGSFDGTNYLTSLKWTAWQDVPQVSISERIPTGAQIVTAAEGAVLEPVTAGYRYYTKTVGSVKKGDVVDLTYSYTVAAGAASGSAGATGTDPAIVPLVLILGLGIGGMGLTIFAVQRKMAAKAAVREPIAAPKRTKAVETAFDDEDEAEPADEAPAPTKTRRKAAATKASAVASTPAKTVSKSRKKPVPEPEPEPPARKRNMLLPTIAVVGLFAAGIVGIGMISSSAPIVNGKITKDFGAASPCTKATIPVTPAEGVDLAAKGGAIVDAFKGQDGVGPVTLDIAASVVNVEFCASSQSEESMRQFLTATGLVTVGASPEVPPVEATVSKSGKKQTVSVDTAGGTFAPNRILLKAGVPAEIEFAQTTACTSQILIADFGIDLDVSAAAGTAKLPAMKAGTYEFACGQGHATGQLVVQ